MKLTCSIGDLKMLEQFHAAYRSLKYIPEGTGKLRQLRIMDVSYSEIHQLPLTIDKLPLLQHLYLVDCHNIQILPNLPLSLTILHISSKSLKKPPYLSNKGCLCDLLLCNHTDMRMRNLSTSKSLRIVRQSGTITMPGNLKTLRMNQCCLPQSSLDLSGLKMLQYLELLIAKSWRWSEWSKAWKFLKKLTIFGCPSLRKISKSTRHWESSNLNWWWYIRIRCKSPFKCCTCNFTIKNL